MFFKHVVFNISLSYNLNNSEFKVDNKLDYWIRLDKYHLDTILGYFLLKRNCVHWSFPKLLATTNLI